MADPRPFPSALRVAARYGLPLDPGTARIAPEDVDGVIARAGFDGLTGFLAAAILDGLVVTDAETAARVVETWRAALRGVVLVEAFAVRHAVVLDDAGIRWRLTKGAGLAHLDYRRQLSQRTFGDVDLMIHPDDWTSALAALTDVGLRRPAPELRPGYDRRFGKGATFVDERGWELDLHLRFAIGRFGVRAETAELFERADEIELGGRTVPVLAGPDRLLHACHHLVLGGFSGLRVARDVAQLLLVSEVDWHDTVETSTRWHVDAAVASGIVQAWERLELDVDHPAHAWAADHPIGRSDARAMRVFTEERPFRNQALTAVPALPRRKVPAYILALTRPSRAWRTGRSGQLTRLRRTLLANRDRRR